MEQNSSLLFGSMHVYIAQSCKICTCRASRYCKVIIIVIIVIAKSFIIELQFAFPNVGRNFFFAICWKKK